MRKRIIVTAFILISTICLIGFTTEFGTREFDLLITPPAKPNDVTITYKNNSEKTFKSADEFLKDIHSKHNDPTAINIMKKLILYKDLQKHVPEIRDRMNWIDENRQVYLFVSTFDNYETKFGVMKDVKVYDLYDAETGEHIATDVTGKAPDGFEPPIKRHRK